MDTALIQSLPHAPPVPLAPPTLDPLALALAVERSLKDAILAHRTARCDAIAAAAESLAPLAGVPPDAIAAAGGAASLASLVWDPWLEALLHSALTAYETVSCDWCWAGHPALRLMATTTRSCLAFA